jgi:hypothetical protein
MARRANQPLMETIMRFTVFLRNVFFFMIILLPALAMAQTFAVGQTVEGCGFKGKIVEIKPRPGWDVPFYVIRHQSSTTYYDINCTPAQMRVAADNPPAAPPSQRQPTPLSAQAKPQTKVAQTSASLCKPGAKLEGRWGNSWYEVTVLGTPDADGKCPLSFDGYGRMWDTAMTMDSIRPRGSGPVYKPKNPVAREPATARAQNGAIRDGRYSCHKISPGGQLMHIGYLTVSGGKGTLRGLPEGWTVRGIEPMTDSARGKPMLAYNYRSSAGWNDKLDCELQ